MSAMTEILKRVDTLNHSSKALTSEPVRPRVQASGPLKDSAHGCVRELNTPH